MSEAIIPRLCETGGIRSRNTSPCSAAALASHAHAEDRSELPFERAPDGGRGGANTKDREMLSQEVCGKEVGLKSLHVCLGGPRNRPPVLNLAAFTLLPSVDGADKGPAHLPPERASNAQRLFHREVVPANRPCLQEDTQQKALRILECKSIECKTLNKRWLFCAYVWIRTGKPKPRSVFGVQYCRRLMFSDGLGDLYYVSEFRKGELVSVCNRASIRSLTFHLASEELEPRPNNVPKLMSIRLQYDTADADKHSCTNAKNGEEKEQVDEDGFRVEDEESAVFHLVAENEEQLKTMIEMFTPPDNDKGGAVVNRMVIFYSNAQAHGDVGPAIKNMHYIPKLLKLFHNLLK